MFPVWKQMRKTQINHNHCAGEESTWEEMKCVFLRGWPVCRCTSGLGVLHSDPRLRETLSSFKHDRILRWQDWLRGRGRRPEVEPYYVGKWKGFYCANSVSRVWTSAVSQSTCGEDASHHAFPVMRRVVSRGGKVQARSAAEWKRLAGPLLLWYEGIFRLLWRVSFFSLW